MYLSTVSKETPIYIDLTLHRLLLGWEGGGGVVVYCTVYVPDQVQTDNLVVVVHDKEIG